MPKQRSRAARQRPHSALLISAAQDERGVGQSARMNGRGRHIPPSPSVAARIGRHKNNINSVLNDTSGINLGAVYETVVAQELKSHGHELFYYDRKKIGEVDYLIDDYENLSITPIEIKSGKDFTNFKALPKLVNNENYHIKNAYIFSNFKDVKVIDNITYMPIYYIMFL